MNIKTSDNDYSVKFVFETLESNRKDYSEELSTKRRRVLQNNPIMSAIKLESEDIINQDMTTVLYGLFKQEMMNEEINILMAQTQNAINMLRQNINVYQKYIDSYNNFGKRILEFLHTVN